jgi:DNA-binding response OmpR family regulator
MYMVKILIADDDPVTLGIMEEVITSIQGDITVLTAENGAQAVEKAKFNHPDIIFLDGVMPMLSGFEACEMIRADADMRDAYVVMVSALDKDEYEGKGLENGIDQFMMKPFDPDDLIDIVEEIILTKHFGS